MKNIKLIQHLFLPIILCACSPTPDLAPEYKIAFRNDKDGNTLQGSKEELIQYIRSGASVRIGWGSKGKARTIEHLSDPIWLAVLNETEVIAHLDAQYLSIINWNQLTASYDDSTTINQEWRVVLNTNGEFDAVWYDKFEGKQIRRVPQKHPMTWFVKGGIADNKPLFLNE